MTTRVHFVYKCSHVLELQDDLVPTWIMKEYFGAVDYDPNTWQGLTHDYGTVAVDDDCSTCKETAASQRRQNTGQSPGAGPESVAISPSTSSQQNNRGSGIGGRKQK